MQSFACITCEFLLLLESQIRIGTIKFAIRTIPARRRALSRQFFLHRPRGGRPVSGARCTPALSSHWTVITS